MFNEALLTLTCTLVEKSKMLQNKIFRVCNYILLCVNIYTKVSMYYYFLLKIVGKEAIGQKQIWINTCLITALHLMYHTGLLQSSLV